MKMKMDLEKNSRKIEKFTKGDVFSPFSDLVKFTNSNPKPGEWWHISYMNHKYIIKIPESKEGWKCIENICARYYYPKGNIEEPNRVIFHSKALLKDYQLYLRENHIDKNKIEEDYEIY